MVGELWRLDRVLRETGLSKPTIYRAMDAKTFPASVEISKRAVGWIQAEIEAWKAERIARRDTREAE